MRASRFLGLFLTALLVLVTAVSAQQPGQIPGVKTAPQVKPPAGGGADPGNWPKLIHGKTLANTVADMRSAGDAALREAAVRSLPLFGPSAREVGAANLMHAMKQDLDVNVRVAAVDVTPAIAMANGYLGTPDKIYEDGLNALVTAMDSEFYPIRYEAVQSVLGFGQYARVAQPKIIPRLIQQTKTTNSWQLRRVAIASIAVIGQPIDVGDPMAKPDPDPAAVSAVLELLKNDQCAAVRREAASALLVLGPVSAGQVKTWRTDLEAVIKKEKDKSVSLWSRTTLVRNDPAGPKANEAHLAAIADVLTIPEVAGRLEACQAFAYLAEDGVGKLRELLTTIQNDKEPIVQAAAMQAAATMKSQAAAIVPILTTVLNSSTNTDVRKVAENAIMEVNKKPVAAMPRKN